MASPLILGNDIRDMSELVKEIVTKKELIAIDQDPLCKAAKRVKKGTVDVLARPLADGSVAICFFNKSSHGAKAKFDSNKLCEDENIALKKQPSYHAKEVWSGDELDTNGVISVKLDKSQSKVFIVK